MSALDERPRLAEEFLWNRLRARLVNAGKYEAAASLDEVLRSRLGPSRAGPDENFTTVSFDMFFRASAVEIELAAATGELLHLHVEAHEREPTEALPDYVALEIAEAAADLPSGAVRTSARYESIGAGTFFRAEWAHMHEGVLVEHDGVVVFVNGRSGKLVSVSRRWHTVSLDFVDRDAT